MADKLWQHLTSYPFVHDSIHVFKNNHFGAKSINITRGGYETFVVPTLPYFRGPYSYFAPYVSKADELGDKSLSKIEERVPIVKSETEQIKNSAFGVLYWPLGKFDDGKKYAFSTYNSQYENARGDGLVKFSRALFGTGLTFTADALDLVDSIVRTKSQEGKEVVQEKTNK